MGQAVVELAGDYGYHKQKYGSTRQNSVVSETYGGSWTWYLAERTGLELNYSRNTSTIKEFETSSLGSGISIINSKNEVITSDYGIGLRQAFASRKSRFVPTLSLGYAKVFTEDRTDYTVDASGTLLTVPGTVSKTRFDAVFATIGLQIGLTKTIALRGSAKTLFKAFKFNEAKYNIRYTAGLSWLF